MTSAERPDRIFGKAEPLDVNLEEVRGMIPEQFKTNGELDVYKMVAGYHEKTNANNRPAASHDEQNAQQESQHECHPGRTANRVRR